ncbi:MAG: peptidoglycan DD-metalloendopeptidase family protein [Pseudomonas sp.]
MTPKQSKPPLYPKVHLIAASGAAALLSLTLLVFPSREVEAQRTYLELDSSIEQIAHEKSDLLPEIFSEAKADSPFAQIKDLAKISAGLSTDNEKAGNIGNGKKVALAVSAPRPPEPSQKRVTVSNGDTLSTLFNQVGLSSTDLYTVLDSSKEAKQFSRLKVGQVLEFQLTPTGELESLHSKLSDLESISLARDDTGFAFTRDRIKPEVRSAYTRGVINSSLFLSAKRAGLSHRMTMDLANVFGYDIDFAQDIREGDEFEVVYEEKVINGKQVGSGKILAARFTNRGKSYSAVRYTTKSGTSSYYTADGKSMRKAFIRTPVDFARISSRFSNGRRHPILNKIRAHKGVDYAAPRGTPIKATGDGKVLLAGRKGGYGNAVVIQHGNKYRTLYAHMRGFAKSVHTGSMVKQGQIIGYIGTTGLSTGPHLHYEFQVNGVHVDPLGQKLPMADPMARNEKQRFLQQSQPIMARMDQEKATMLALNKR